MVGLIGLMLVYTILAGIRSCLVVGISQDEFLALSCLNIIRAFSR